MSKKKEAMEWVRYNSMPRPSGGRVVPQEVYDQIDDEELRGAVDELVGPFETHDRGEYAYAEVAPSMY